MKYKVKQVQSALSVNAYENLANAIIVTATKDYRQALKRLQKNSKNIEANKIKGEVERFFRSCWFEELTSVSGELLLRKLQEEVAQA